MQSAWWQGAGARGPRHLCWALLAVACLCANTTSAGATTWYVRPSGADSNSGQSPTAALRTVGFAAQQARADDRIVVAPGIYHEGDIRPQGFARIALIADRQGIEFGVSAGDVVLDATGFGSGIELNHNLAFTVDGFVIYGSSVGIYVKSQAHRAVVSNNRVSRCGSNGIYVQDSEDVTVFNNLAYANGGSGVLITGSVGGSPRFSVVNNTVFRNGNRGIFVSGTTVGSADGLIINNALSGNVTSNGTPVGIQVNASSRSGYVSGGNITADRFASSTPIDATDVVTDPQFVDPAGADGQLGGAAYADDRFQLSQVNAGQAFDSPAVDAGTDRARAIGFGRASTRTDGRSDRSWVDAGYHYGYFGKAPTNPAGSIRSRDVFVSAADGNDNNDGSTASLAFKTIGAALVQAKEGARIVVLPGTYPEGGIGFPASGEPRRPLVLHGEGKPVIDARSLQRGLLLSTRSDVLVENFSILGGGDAAIEVRNAAKGVTLRNLEISGARRGIYVNGGGEATADHVTINASTSRGAQVSGVSSLQLVDSVIDGAPDQGLWATEGATVVLTRSHIRGSLAEGALIDGSMLRSTDSELTGNGAAGVRFVNSASASHTRDNVHDNAGGGMRIFDSAVTVTGGRIAVNQRDGLQVLISATPNTSQVQLTGVDISGNQASGVWAQRATANVSGGTLCHNGDAGMTGDRAQINLSQVLLCDNTGEGLTQSEGQLSIVGSEISGNGKDGIGVAMLATFNLQGSKVDANVGNGVQAASSSMTASMTELCRNGAAGLRVQDSTLAANDLLLCENTVEGFRQDGSSAQLARPTVRGNAQKGISSVNATLLDIQDGMIDHNQDTGVLVIGGATTRLSRTTVCDNPAVGVRLQDSAAVLTDVTVCRNENDGIRQANGSAALVRVTVTQNSKKGISASGQQAFSLTSGVITGNFDTGVQIANGTSASITDSEISENQGNGVTASRNTGVVSIQRTTLQGNSGAGVMTQGGTVSVEQSRVSGSGSGGVRASGGGLTIIKDSTVALNVDAGVQVVSASLNVIGSRLDRNTRVGLEALVDATSSDPANATIEGSSICRTQGIGVRGDAAAIHLTGSTVCENDDAGIRQNLASLTLEQTNVRDNHAGGVVATSASPVSITGGGVLRNGKDGVSVLTTQSLQLDDVLIDSNHDVGVLLAEVADANVQRVRARNNGRSGISATASAVRLMSGLITGSGEDGVRSACGHVAGGVSTACGSIDVAKTTVRDSIGNGMSSTLMTRATISDSRIFHNGQNGAQVASTANVAVSRSELFGNNGDGVTLVDAPGATIWNNLLYGNCSTGVLIGTEEIGSMGVQVLNNTVVGNVDRGIFVRGTRLNPASPGATVMRNILQGNGTAGIQVNRESEAGYVGDYNLSLDRYAAPLGAHDILDNPQFVAPLSGACGTPGTGDFHLRQVAAGQTPQSPAVDAGGIDVIAAGLQGTSTRTDRGLDTGTVDLGYHFQP